MQIVDASVVDKYVTYLNSDKKLSANSKRQRIAACSSFFSDLERWEVITKNPFKNAKHLHKQKISIKPADKIPANTDLYLLEAYPLNQI